MGDVEQRKYSGREITEDDIELIKWILKTYKSLSRTELIYTISESLEWTRPEDGAAKERQCRICLESLEREGLITLPAARAYTKSAVSFQKITPPLDNITEGGPLELRIPRGAAENKRWRSYIEQYHLLGYKGEKGASLRYFVVSGETEVGCMQFSSAAWALEDRDRWVGWSKEMKAANLRLIANHMRYLLLPWGAQIHNLASKALGKAAKQLQGDWLSAYGYAPAMLETFVDSSLYKGTCYKAANWMQIGETKGRGRNDRHHNQELTKKLIFVYPLQKDYREVLHGIKAYRRMDI